MTEDEEFIYEAIFDQVRMGVFSIEEIKENVSEAIEDNGFANEISNEWAFKTIEGEYNELASESLKWIKPTDSERLVKAFDQLCKSNIIALHCAGYTTSDGENEVIEVETRLQHNQITSDGYCFYHEQDLVRALSNEKPSLTISFQKIGNSNDKVTTDIGRRVVRALKEQGLKIEWNEDPTRKIVLPNFKWQWLFDKTKRDIMDHSNTIRLIMGRQDSTSYKGDSGNPKRRHGSSKTNIWSKFRGLWS